MTTTATRQCCPNPSLIDYTHRSPGTPHTDQSLCFNGKPKAEHRCITECSKPGRLCLNCRLLIDLSGM